MRPRAHNFNAAAARYGPCAAVFFLPLPADQHAPTAATGMHAPLLGRAAAGRTVLPLVRAARRRAQTARRQPAGALALLSAELADRRGVL